LNSEKIPLKFRRSDQTTTKTESVNAFDLFREFGTGSEFKEAAQEGLAGASTASEANQYINQLVVVGAIRGLLGEELINFRKALEMLKGGTCYHEDFIYSLRKTKDSDVESNFVQNIYKRATDDNTILIDTQIKYGGRYFYKGVGHYIIIGNTYRYLSAEFGPDDEEPYADITVENSPRIMILPVSLFNEETLVIQPPPLTPQVQIKTEMNSSNEIQFYLYPTNGKKHDHFITIRPEDNTQLGLMTTNSRTGHDKFLFQSSLDNGLFEIFRMPFPPSSLLDYSNFKLSEKRMTYNSERAVFKDKVVANTKYYYMFRAVNYKGLVSNPSSIYEVELIKDADDSKVSVRVYEPPPVITERKAHKFQQLFQIKPALPHTIFDDYQESLLGEDSLRRMLDQVELGIAPKSVWGRKFKFRIRSKSTGKIIDYNVTFKLTRDKTEEDFN
jgi:hypothetical protein